MKIRNVLLLLMVIATAMGCGSPRGGAGGGAAGGGGVIGASVLSLTMSATTLAAGANATVTATLVDGAGTPVANAKVIFSTSQTSDTFLGNFSTVSATTNANGIVSVVLTAGTVGGAATITAASGGASAALTYTVNVGSVSLALTNPATGAAVSNITIGSPIKVTATVVDGAGAVVVGAVVTFSTNTAIGKIIPASATALTDATGKASVNLDGVVAGAATVTVTVQLGASALTGSAAYSVGAAILTMPNPIVFGINPLSANGSTSVSVDVFSGGALVTTPVSVTFSSTCSVAGTATISSPVTTVGGTATATYTDRGCGAADTITASVASTSLTGILTITPPSAGSIQFISAVPAQISLKGTGGAGRQETSIVTFKVLDTAGNPLAGKAVTFALSTTVGGITLSQANGTTDVLGQVSTVVASGTISTPVRVIATTPGTGVTLQTLSDVLTITTGIPDQDSASLSATKLNIEGWTVDGTTTILTMRLADHFNNPVTDGTAVNFVTEGGQVIGSCTTIGSACSATLTSANPRPAIDGRVTVLAFAVGEESFIDLNGNGLVDNATEMVDINGLSTDVAEAFSDFNENGLRDPAEPFIDFNADGLFTRADGKYSGVLCNPAAGVFCAASPNVHVRASKVIVFSSSVPAPITVTPASPIDLVGGVIPNPQIASDCNKTQKTVTLRITDVNKNAMPVGTTIKFTTTNGTLIGTSSFVVPNSTVNALTSILPPPPAPQIFPAIDYQVTLKSDSQLVTVIGGTNFCTDPTPKGNLIVTVTTPLGVVTVDSTTVVVNN